ncbi:MAG: DEAD/DEAH box helicase, partial [Prevotellaceae bacterium]|nr:DEAD/DEAH box helicase [Prevotellaceae bacterium]
MTTERFLNRFAEQPSFAQLMAQLRQPAACVHASHLAGSARSVLGAAAARQLGGLHLFILNERDEAAYFYNDLYNLLGERDVLFFPSSYRRSIAHGEEDSAAAIQRTTALAAIAEAGKRKQLLVVGYPESVAEKVVSGEALQRNTLTLHVGEKLGMDFVRDTLLEYLFERCDFVYEPGQFAIRGSIIDVFSYSDSKPYRIDFFGNEVESLRSFNLNTQLSDEKRSEVEIVPNLRRTESERISLFDFVGKQSRDKGFGVTAWVNDLSFAAEKINAMADGKTAADKDFSAVVIGSAELENSLRGLRRVLLSKPVSGSQQGMSECAFGTASQPAFNKNYELLASTLLENEAAGYANLLLTESLLQAERLDGILTGMASASPAAQRHSKLYEQLPLVLHEGFTCHASKLCCYTDHQLFARYHRYKLHGAPEKSEQLTIQELNSLQVGDYVVHIDHGVGTFGGLVKQRVANGKMCEFIKITYRDGDVLMVSVHGLHRISRFRGREGGEPPKIYKLGSGAWQRLKSAAKSKVKDIARDLIKLYAQRKQTQGFAFAPDTYMQHELEASFMYEDTPDQLKTTLAVKSDMEAEAPMDRLICGDVGFGKTEIAIRAAFKAVADSKQVAVLVPTTLLALQHHKTFCRRLRHFPCRTEYLSRFKSAGEVKAIADDLAEGKIDIIIGTHKLLGKGVSFKDLGLLIIDEEQKFGVAAKEKLRQLRLDVDTLTLTATPIPRTLQFSLMGARDLSVIHTPPPNRQPVATAVHTFDEDVIREAVEQELARGGQVFFVHNHVKDIADIEGIVRRICPRARTTCAHGQMEGNEMEKRVIDFVLGEYDVLVATSIVENGIDIPNANTIIINDAHHFGLSDLHQLRGRVGRSNRKAYCYLLAPPESLLSGDA